GHQLGREPLGSTPNRRRPRPRRGGRNSLPGLQQEVPVDGPVPRRTARQRCTHERPRVHSLPRAPARKLADNATPVTRAPEPSPGWHVTHHRSQLSVGRTSPSAPHSASAFIILRFPFRSPSSASSALSFSLYQVSVVFFLLRRMAQTPE